jgi:hypothetical protein
MGLELLGRPCYAQMATVEKLMSTFFVEEVLGSTGEKLGNRPICLFLHPLKTRRLGPFLGTKSVLSEVAPTVANFPQILMVNRNCGVNLFESLLPVFDSMIPLKIGFKFRI